MSEPEPEAFARFEDLARRLVNTPKPKPSADDLPPSAAGEPADERPEREEADRDGS